MSGLICNTFFVGLHAEQNHFKRGLEHSFNKNIKNRNITNF
jgi:hypothetical protein